MITFTLALLLAASPTTVAVPIPGGNGGVGFDDLGFSPALHRLLVPGGRTGNLDVRYVPALGEVWVTEPGAEQIEIFSIPATGTPVPAHAGTVKVAGGPESLVIGAERAWTHLWKRE